MNIKKNDTVMILSGKDKGKKGKVLSASPKTSRVIVEGANFVKVHISGQKTGGRESGIIRKEASIHVSNVIHICPKCGEKTRTAHSFEDGHKVRVCKKCEDTI